MILPVNSGSLMSHLATLRRNLEDIEKEAQAAPADNLEDCFKTVMTVSKDQREREGGRERERGEREDVVSSLSLSLSFSSF